MGRDLKGGKMDIQFRLGTVDDAAMIVGSSMSLRNMRSCQRRETGYSTVCSEKRSRNSAKDSMIKALDLFQGFFFWRRFHS